MTVIYMANRQYYVYKTILGRENLNNFCQPSKEADVGSDPGILFPLLSYLRVFCQDATLWNNTKCLQKCLHKPHRPVEDMITLLSQPEFSNSRAALASGEEKYLSSRKTMEPSQQPQLLHPTLFPSAEDILQWTPYLPHRGRSHPQTTSAPRHQPEHLINSLPSSVLGLLCFFSSLKALCPFVTSLSKALPQIDRQTGRTARAQKRPQTGSVPLGLGN